MKKIYIAPMTRCFVTSNTDMLCTSGSPNIIKNGDDGDYATNDRSGGDDGTDSYIKNQNLWDFEW